MTDKKRVHEYGAGYRTIYNLSRPRHTQTPSPLVIVMGLSDIPSEITLSSVVWGAHPRKLYLLVLGMNWYRNKNKLTAEACNVVARASNHSDVRGALKRLRCD